MLKKRIIPTLLLRGQKMVKGKQYDNYRITGLPKTSVRTYSAQDADEILIINIDSEPSGFDFLVESLKEASKECFMPLTLGGKISNINQVDQLFLSGADKVLITSALFENPDLAKSVSTKYGTQSLVGGVDYIYQQNTPILTTRLGTKLHKEISIIDYAQKLERNGVGELMLSCISRDGCQQGYDLDLVRHIANSVNIPVIASCGAGNFQHVADLLSTTNASAAACGSLFYFGDNNPIRARSFMRNKKIPMRILK